MKTQLRIRCVHNLVGHATSWRRQGGVVLFIALIALVAMTLAAIALVRSVDTSTTIAGNLAFKQAATSTADSGFETSIPWLTATENTEKTAGRDPWTDSTHAFNIDAPANGYYSSIAEPVDLTASTTWGSATSRPATGNYFTGGVDSKTGNEVRYIIQRMCRTKNQLLSEANCLFSDAESDNKSKRVLNANEAGGGSGAVSGSPLYRVTARVTGPKNTVSYIQAYTY